MPVREKCNAGISGFTGIFVDNMIWKRDNNPGYFDKFFKMKRQKGEENETGDKI